jgi:hypothetical protein
MDNHHCPLPLGVRARLSKGDHLWLFATHTLIGKPLSGQKVCHRGGCIRVQMSTAKEPEHGHMEDRVGLYKRLLQSLEL